MIELNLSRIYDIFSIMNSQPECLICRKCEEQVGLVYVLSTEVATLKKLHIPMLCTSEGISYLERNRDGWCTCYNSDKGTCKIYINRPLCCRIYPLDLLMIDNQLWWVLHENCPMTERFIKSRQLALLCALTIDLENELTDNEIHEWIKQDKTSKRIEYMSAEILKTIKLRKFKEQHILP